MAENSETISQRISATRSRQHRQLQFCCQHDGSEQEQHHHQKPHRRHHRQHRQHHCTMLKMMLLIACCSYALLPTAALAKGYHDDHSGGDPMEMAARTSDGDSAEASVEILPAPRFRHQEHYEHRIEQAVNDFKRQQQLQLQREVPSASGGGGNKEPLPKKSPTMPPEHHRRHEHKLQQQQKVLEFKRQEPYSPSLQQQHEEPHHVRHHHNHNGNNKNNRNHNDQTHGNALPPLRHHRHHQLERLHQLPLQQQQLNRKQQQHVDSMSTSDSSSSSSLINADDDIIQSSKSPGGRPYYAAASLSPQPNGTSTATGNKTTKPSRYFDRDGLYVADTPAAGSKDWRWKSLAGRTTEGPLLISSPLDSPEEDDDEEQRDDQKSKHEGSARYSLKFLPDDEDNNNYEDYDDTDKDDKPVGDGDDDDGDNYSYEDVGAEENKLQMYEFPGSFSASAAKASVKRLTNPFRQNDKNRRSASDNGYAPQDQLDRFEYKHYEHKRLREIQTRDAVKSRQQQLQHDTTNELESIHSAGYQKGKLTAYKQNKLGSPEGVRNDRMDFQNHKSKAIAHNKLVMKEGSCRLPQRRFLRIQRDLSKVYMPHYTMLYRCADDTGCCRSERETCGPKRTENVDMYFHVKSINSHKFHVESLTFVNHTECHCIDRTELQQQQQQSQQIQMEPSVGGYAPRRSPPTRHASIFSCNCPKMFEKILQDNGQCRCDCSSGNTDCDYLKRGQEHFSMNDRICILEGRCKVPICEFGPYKKEYGCCPKFSEKQSIGFNKSDDGGSEAAKSSRKLFASNALPSHKFR